MLQNQTLEHLRELRLTAMAEAYTRQIQDPHMNDLSFDERFGLLVDHERTERHNRQLVRLLREAHLKVNAAPEEIDYTVARGLEASVVRHLVTGQWITGRQNLIVCGPTGVGKTFLVCALGTAACRQGYRVRYYRLSRLLQDIAVAKADGSYSRLARQLASADLLILDDWGLAPMSAPEGRELLDILDDRTSAHSTCVASQLPIEAWYGTFADPTVADAVLDRLVHNAHKLLLKGESMRKLRNGLPQAEKIGK
ncbi:ATPase AAA [Alicyclobacillus hesperidum subsp. aegles]|uniref:IS21-like element helper ATPase IstB n=1 Tax=Alicyclobacillus hesperidum TaxID=89784 RepID=UPI00222A3A34|nr:IS21-like element helper ATPase IstB [Alicyclobacillus hesperidum]GLG02824.1 ATPase AAA [Alicyclobacillus hesperidum subsp. aegles]